MNNPDPLADLRDIHLPEAISIWPLAPGWFVVIAGCLAVIAWLAWRLNRRHRSRLYRRQALQQLQHIIDEGHSPQQLQRLFALLRQTANTVYDEQRFSSLGVVDFIDFLKATSRLQLFDCDPEALQRALYASDKDATADNYQQLCTVLVRDTQRWISQHRTDHRGGNAC
ncbi:MAG: DUF4381 domain-containing protein [Cellvibrionales bacterium]|tara:strand:+ start:11132 stop:11638 length:507 start_codon:yes stop_codon:yes gene_type:complete